jgi:hypothetical protein
MTTELTISPPVEAEHDRIQAVKDTPMWAENLVFEVHDAASGLAIWCHWGRIPGHPEIWEGVIAVYLDHGELLVSRSFGRSPSDQTASSGPLWFRCIEPGRLWSLGFDGMARATTSAEASRGPLRDGPVERLEVELTFTALAPLWSAHRAMDEQAWANAHLEQAGRIVGALELRGRRIEIDAFGMRDHSYGPRDYSRLLGDTWCAAVFPSGRALLAIDVWQLDGPALSKGFVWNGVELHEARAIEPARLESADGAPHRFEFSLATPAGVERIAVEQRHCMMWTMDEPSALIPGASAGDQRIYATEGPAMITWGDERAGGWMEKTLRLAR